MAGGAATAPGLLLQDHSLFVCSSTNQVLRYDTVTGAFSGTFISAQSGLDLPVELVFGPDANGEGLAADVYVSCFGDSSVRRFDGTSGVPIGDGSFVRPGAGGLDGPVGLAFRNQVLYVASWTTHQVLCFDSRTGNFLGEFVAAGAGGLKNPSSLVFGDDRHLYVSSDTAVLPRRCAHRVRCSQDHWAGPERRNSSPQKVADWSPREGWHLSQDISSSPVAGIRWCSTTHSRDV